MLFRKYLKCSGKSCERVAGDKCRIIDVFDTIYRTRGLITLLFIIIPGFFISFQARSKGYYNLVGKIIACSFTGVEVEIFLVRPYTTQSHLTELLKMHTLKTSLTKILMRKFRRFVFIEVFSMLLMN